MSNKKKSRLGQRIFLLAIFLSGFVVIFLLSRMEHNFSSLPYFYPERVEQRMVDGQLQSDTIWSKVPDFSFIDHNGEELTQTHIEGRVTVVDFFFTTCRTICPIMTRQMRNLVWELDDPLFEEVRFLSFTVDPEFDTAEVLKKYRRKNDIHDTRWSMITGGQEEIYELGVEAFRVSTQEVVEEQGNFLHSEKMILVDTEGHVRGIYDGTDTDEMRRLEEDIKILVGTDRKARKRERRQKDN